MLCDGCIMEVIESLEMVRNLVEINLALGQSNKSEQLTYQELPCRPFHGKRMSGDQFCPMAKRRTETGWDRVQ